MNIPAKLKPISIALITVILLSGCSTGNSPVQMESQNTQIDQAASSSIQPDNAPISQSTSSSSQSSKSTQSNPAASSSDQSSDTHEKTVSKLFGDISDYQIENPETYYDDVFKFSVEYPSAWKIPIPDKEINTVTPDGDPEKGVFISVDNKRFFKPEENEYFNNIYVYHAVGNIQFYNFEDRINELTEEDFTTSENISGKIAYVKRKGYLYIYLILGEGAFYGARMIISDDLFDKYKDQVYGILKSIKVTDPDSL